ncbi:MAG: homoserine kinase [Elusimicrobia bacterium]|nr:homoserine kinase [Elusimicrobiota bacterium]
MNKIKIKIPATTSNFGAGYDVLGAALKLYNEIEVNIVQCPKSNVRGLKIDIEGEGEEKLPRDEKNIVWQAMKKVFDILHITHNTLHIRFINHIPLARGLGSSAAARLGGFIAANKICGSKLSDNEIIQMVTKLEGHPDNVVPSLFGGLCVCNYNGKDIKCTKIKMPGDLKAVLCIPDFEVSTDKARKILPKMISREDAVFNSSRVGFFLSAIIQKKYNLLGTAMEDRLHQPYRKKLIPGMEEVFSSAKKSGAYGVCISGSGSTILSLSSQRLSVGIGKSMQRAFAGHRIKSKYIVCDFDNKGVLVSKFL